MKTQAYLGKHTAISQLAGTDLKGIPYIGENDGAIPPFVIAVGDSRRVTNAVKSLKLKDVVNLHEEGEKRFGVKGRGRVDITLGTFTSGSEKLPIAIVETQMGMPATEINLREVLSHCSPVYRFKKRAISVGGIYVIRVGTAGGINDGRKGEQKIAVGDIINGAFSIGWSGTLIESIAGLDFSDPVTIKSFKTRWIGAGNHFTDDGRYPLADSSRELVDSIQDTAIGMGLRIHKGGNFSKDSLYAEIDDNAFVELRRKYNVMSTEMEQMAIAKLRGDFAVRGIKLHIGLISGVIGLLPGASFSTDEKNTKAIEKVEDDSLKIAAHALWNIVYSKK